ncbi:MAG: hypothetical protein QNK65_09115 [Flavobacteriales bacterium]|jgi:hypothetical protein|tara:strand:+ start:2671 stop:2937 length:267 start_codon:yes stop_codon:yes gene_type:complete
MKAPRLPSFLKTTVNKQFQMPTRYYNERKERVEEAIERANTKNHGSISKGHFSNAWSKKPAKPNTSSSIRVLVLIVMLSVLAYWILKF